VCLLPREDLDAWWSLGSRASEPLGGRAAEIREALSRRGPSFFADLVRAARLPAAAVEEGLAELIGRGRVTCDSFAGLRWLIVPAWRRKGGGLTAGRWSLLPEEAGPPASPEFVARRMLQRTGVVFRKTLARERHPVPWRDLARACRMLEARGEVRGGRFVAGFDGEQYALPEAVTLLRDIRRRGDRAAGATAVSVAAADPLNFQGILTPDERVSPVTRQKVLVG
jgi:ATP-dependent Lhr-like helicase